MYVYMGIVHASVHSLQCLSAAALQSYWPLAQRDMPRLLPTVEAMFLDTFWKTLDDSMFVTSASFQKEIPYKALDCQELQDGQSLQALCVFMHYELVCILSNAWHATPHVHWSKVKAQVNFSGFAQRRGASSTSSSTSLCHACQRFAAIVFLRFRTSVF